MENVMVKWVFLDPSKMYFSRYLQKLLLELIQSLSAIQLWCHNLPEEDFLLIGQFFSECEEKSKSSGFSWRVSEIYPESIISESSQPISTNKVSNERVWLKLLVLINIFEKNQKLRIFSWKIKKGLRARGTYAQIFNFLETLL